MSATIEIVGIEEVQTLLQDFAKISEDEGVMTEAAAILLDHNKERFLSQTDPKGAQWPVSNAALNRAALGIDGGTLFDTGTLFHSLSVGTTGKMQRSIYTTVSYAPQHQLGEGVVQRAFLGFSDSDIETIEKLVTDRVDKVR